MLEIKSYSTDSKLELVAAKEVLEMTRQVKDIFMSSKLYEKQQLLGLYFSNLMLNDEKFDVELRELFNLMANVQDQHIWRG